ncbi:hypothetical protein D3C85_1803380 [compost metagenome]
MRSQVSSTASKVSREWSAKRSRAFSVSTSSQSYNRKSSVARKPMIHSSLIETNRAARCGPV